jgi:acyl dehydratase
MLSSLTGKKNYFEDFKLGDVIEHARGKTLEALENVLITNLVMNTSQGHFNEDAMSKTPFGRRVSFGGVNFSLVMGLASQDTCEQAITELGFDNIKLMKPVVHGDTLYAFSEVLTAEPSERADAGVITFRHYGVNQRNELVAQVDRRILVKRRPS